MTAVSSTANPNLKNNYKAVLASVSATLGSGITLMTAVINLVGFKYYIFLMTFVFIMSYLSTYYLSYTASFLSAESEEKKDDKKKEELDLSYEGIAGRFSKNIKHLVMIAILFSCLSSIFSFTQRIMDSSMFLLQDISFIKDNINNSVLRYTILSLLSSSLYFLFCLTDLSSLSIFSSISIGSAISFSIIMFIYSITYNGPTIELFFVPEKIELKKAFGYCVFALHNQSCFLDIYKTFADTSLSNMNIICLGGAFFGTLLYGLVGYFGYKGIGRGLGDMSVLTLFSKPDHPVYAELVSRPYLKYVPTFINCIFCPIYFSAIVFSMYPVIRLCQNIGSRFSTSEIPRKKIALFATFLIFFFGFIKSDKIDGLLALFGYLLTTPLSFTFPAYFVFCCVRKKNLLKYSSVIMQIISISLMIVLTSLEIYEKVYGEE